jgi:SRSO17 transposase
LRVGLEQQEIPHVLAARSNEPLWATTDQGPTQVAAAQLVAQVNPAEWVRLSAGEGAKGPRIYDWVRVAIRPFAEPDQGYWLLARRSVAKPEELAYYVCFGPGEATLEELVRVAGTRWAIEESFEEAKGEVGLDQYEVRRWVGWYRHLTLALLAHAFLAVTRAQSGGQKGGAWL